VREPLASEIDSETPALLVVEPERCDSALDRRRFAHRLNETEQLHLLAANQMGGPPLQVGIYIAGVRRKLGIKPDTDTIRAKTAQAGS
jgi:hypothetical protein